MLYSIRDNFVKLFVKNKVKQEELKKNFAFADGEVDKIWLTPEAELEEEQKEQK